MGNHLPVTYVIADAHQGPCKIGHSRNLQSRLTTIQTNTWQQLTVYGFRVGIWKAGLAPFKSTFSAVSDAARVMEKAAHEKLAEFDLRLNGEWFDVSVADALAVIDKCADIAGIIPLTVERMAAGFLGEGVSSETTDAQSQILRDIMAPAAYIALYQPYPVDRRV